MTDNERNMSAVNLNREYSYMLYRVQAIILENWKAGNELPLP